MEASEAVIRGNVDSLMKLVAALDAAGIELIGEDVVSSSGGRGVRLKSKLDSRRAFRGDNSIAGATRGVRAHA
jgi:hypothetical protein